MAKYLILGSIVFLCVMDISSPEYSDISKYKYLKEFKHLIAY
jgi:hypothetical protein